MASEMKFDTDVAKPVVSQEDQLKLAAKDSNIILQTDSYKVTHHLQRPKNLTGMYAYLESRGGMFPKTVFFGLQYYLQKYLQGVVVSRPKIEQAAKLFAAHFGNAKLFNHTGWEHIVYEHGGRLPVEIMAVAEGTPVPTHNALVTVETTCDKCAWLSTYIESLLLKVWYPTTVATLSYHIRKMLEKFADQTSDNPEVPFGLHDFGDRGTSSEESAAIGGAAHLINFNGTDTIPALEFIMQHYHTDKVAGFSVPAAEHSTICSWGPQGESAAFRNMLDKFPSGIVAVVSDTYDIFNACANLWGGELRDKVMNRDGVLVVRPDSGDPTTVVVKVVKILAEKFGFTVNNKGYMVLDKHVRVIQGDGVNYGSIASICAALEAARFSIENVNFGMGGALLQQVHRDTQQFAFKASAVSFDGVWQPIYKRPATDPTKASKAGCLALIKPPYGNYETMEREHDDVVWNDQLEPVFRNGQILKTYTFEQVRANAHPVEGEEEE